MIVDFTESEPINYKKSYVAFLDVLGFTSLVYSSKKKDKEKIEAYFKTVNTVVNYLKGISAKREIDSIIISDSVILTVPHGQSQHDNVERLRQLCISIGIIQKELALKDVWMRGAISSGDTYFNANKNQIVGPAYIDSYVLEKISAITPRVIIDSKIIGQLGYSSATELIHEINRTRTGGLTASNWGRSILFDWKYPDETTVEYIQQDVPLFIDYLSPIVEENSPPLTTLLKHLENNLYNNTNIYSKFRWIADYLRCLVKREKLNNNPIAPRTDNRLGNL